jgi:methylaspartate mutase epsilon subunit
MEINDRILELAEFENMRKVVLSAWRTGAEVDRDEAAEYLMKIGPEKNLAKRFLRAKKEDEVLVSARAGSALLDEHIALMKYLQDEGGANFLPATIDSHTRHNDYEEADDGIRSSCLNGFPAVNHGVKGCRKVAESVRLPLICRQCAFDPRLLAEITLSGGFSGFVGGPLSFFTSYNKNSLLSSAIRNYQYVDRLVSDYENRGLQILRESFGLAMGIIQPPSISIAMTIIDALLAAKQGVRHLCLTYHQQGNLIQDIAAVRVNDDLCAEYLGQLGISGVKLYRQMNQWIGHYPTDRAQCYGIICLGASVGGLADVQSIIVKTYEEGYGIPSNESNAECLRATKYVLGILRNQRLSESQGLREEREMIRLETKQIIDKVLGLGDGDLAVGSVRAFEAGILDAPFSPNVLIKNRIIPVRDHEGGVRYFDSGNLPFTKEVLEYHKLKISERCKREKQPATFQMVIEDVVRGMNRVLNRIS